MSTEVLADGRYTVERLLGRGGMSTVYLARDGELDRPVAVKVLAEQLLADPDFADRFRREAQTAAGLAHPNVVQVYDTGEEGERLYIVMEYVEGETLSDVVARDGALAPDVVLDLAAQACAALHHAHERGVIHRDVKPGNFILRPDGLLKVTDFGIAHAGDATRLTQVGTILGTLNYLSPEQARGEEVGPAADIYSLGVVLYELFAGEPPRRFESVAHLATLGEEAPRPLRDLAPGVPPHAEQAVMRSLALNPAYRPTSAAELARELRGGEPTSATIPLAARTEERTVPLRRDRSAAQPFGWRALAVLAAVILAIVLAAVALTQSGDDPPATPAQVDDIPEADDPIDKARNLEEWLRENTAEEGG